MNRSTVGCKLVKIPIVPKLKQLYRYHRNWQKYKSRRAKNNDIPQNERQFYSQFIQQGDLCFDVGANIGDKTEIFLQLGATVVAIEPQESCWRVLKRRFAGNSNVHVIGKALDKVVGEKPIFIDRSPTISSMAPKWIDSVKKSGRFAGHDWEYQINIETTTLDMLIDRFGKPAFCKIDVEGFEFEVLQGLSQPVAAISFEFIPEHLDPVLACIEYLSKLGKAEFNFSLADAMLFALPSWIDAGELRTTLTRMDKNAEIVGDIYTRFMSGIGIVDHGRIADSFCRITGAS